MGEIRQELLSHLFVEHWSKLSHHLSVVEDHLKRKGCLLLSVLHSS